MSWQGMGRVEANTKSLAVKLKQRVHWSWWIIYPNMVELISISLEPQIGK